jgi:diadenylate cyclase
MLGYVFRLSNIAAALDILIVSVILYWVMLMFKGTRAERMFWGIAVIVVVYFVSQRVELLTLHWLLSNFLGSLVIFIIVVFQQDIRRALVHLSKPFGSRGGMASRELLDEITQAALSMSRARCGGIIVMERAVELGDYLGAGMEVDAAVSKELLLSIFNTASPLHDGAVIIRRGRLQRAGCILPLTEREIGGSMGTRHRAAMGLAEETDAVVIVVSEETGEVTLVVEDRVMAGLDTARLLAELRALFSVSGSSRFASTSAGSRA